VFGAFAFSAFAFADDCYFTGANQLTQIPGVIDFYVPLSDGRAALIVRPDKKLQLVKRKSNVFSLLSSGDIKDVDKVVESKLINELNHSKSGLYSLVTYNSAIYIVNTEKLEVRQVAKSLQGGGFFTDDDRHLILQNLGELQVIDLENLQAHRFSRSEFNSFLFLDTTGQYLFDIRFKKLPSDVAEVDWMDLKSLAQRTYKGKQIALNFNQVSTIPTIMIGKAKFDLKRPESPPVFLNQATNWPMYEYNHEDGQNDYSDSIRKLTFNDGTKEVYAYLPSQNYQVRSKTASASGYLIDWTEHEDYSFVSTYSRKSYACAKPAPILCGNCGSTGAVTASEAWIMAIPAKAVSCDVSFEQEKTKWVELTSTFKSDLDEQSLLRWLIRLSKPGGFEPREHLNIVLSVLETPAIVKRYGELVSQVMLNVLKTSGNLYATLAVKYSKVLKMLPSAKLVCLNDVEKEQLTGPLFSTLKRGLLNSMASQPLAKFEYVKHYSDFLTVEQKDDLADAIGDVTARNTVSMDSRFHSVFFSKIYQFCYQAARHFLGLKTMPVTDLTIVDGASSCWGCRNGISASVFGSRPVHLLNSGVDLTPRPAAQNEEDDDDEETTPARKDLSEGQSSGGFYFVDGIPIDTSAVGAKSKVQDVTWTVGKLQFLARITINPIAQGNNYFVQEPSLRYSEMLKDHVLRGVVIAGANLEDSQVTIKEYDSYYKAHGFVFADAITIENTKDYLAQKVFGDQPMDYFIKEAHSDGDEKNLFRINLRSKVRIGTRKSGDFTEIIELISPDNSARSELIENQLFGDWVRQREEKGIGQIAYINSSCWSHNKARSEAAAAHSPALIEIPTLTIASTFENTDTNALRLIVDAMRAQKNYAQIREALSVIPGFANRTDDVYIFPDEDDYTKNIVDRSLYKYDFKVEMFENLDGQWSPYHFDQRIHQAN
jgi:hypothetical protein